MAKIFKDFKYCGKKLSDLKTKFCSVDFSVSNEYNFAIQRELNIGNTNRFNTEPNFYGAVWNTPLEFELNIVKDPIKYDTQEKRILTEDDIRQVVKWLSSVEYPMWLEFEYEEDIFEVSATDYCGMFTSITGWGTSSDIYGLRLTFRCTTAFGYTGEIVERYSFDGYKNIVIQNDTDDESGYSYPVVKLSAKKNCNMMIANTTDMNILEKGTLTKDIQKAYGELVFKAKAYAKNHGYKIKFINNQETPIAICNETAFYFYMEDVFGTTKKCTAIFRTDTFQYILSEGCVMFVELKQDLPIIINSDTLTVEDKLGRMVPLKDLGIKDIDYIYYPRLKNGNNTWTMKAENVDVMIIRREVRKVG